MTPEERQRAFLAAIDELSKQYGFQVGAQIQTRQLGPVVQCEPVVVAVAIEGWVEPESSNEHSNGKPILTGEEIKEAMRKR